MSACSPMADLATPRIADPSEASLVAVAYSGGRDSTALLHATARQARALNDAGASLQVLALHVHHGLNTCADDWLAHCESQCETWAQAGLPIRFRSARLEGRPAAGQSVEAWARDGRHAALAAMSAQAGANLLLLAHHQRDQAETLLLQGLRGAGVAGLAGMPAQQWREGLCWARPWLDLPREALEAYVRAHQLTHIDDDSNGDPRFARNRLRLSVWPALLEAFPQAEASLAQAARWAQQSLALQQEVAAEDLRRLLSINGLAVTELLALSPARASNALRAWLALQSGRPAPASLLQRLMRELPACKVGAWCCGAGELRLYRGRLQWRVRASEVAAAEASALTTTEIDLSALGYHPLPAWHGGWQVDPVASGGLACDRLKNLQMRARQGGEQFQLKPAGTLRSLKKVYQEQGIPAWQRRGPLLFAGDTLIFVPGLGLDARFSAAAGEPQVSLAWHEMAGDERA
ncbi:tRNA lysidine(34) synthetase TilS [Roseateles oligotrophus]|uniref:tRNA(Ile)-lysidine synthase n=1 Tax=Roseateles oligotrophus TaxID=1769250 RepID=A0ABT2YGX6_9BURK|nr:tRNA lysidine(34) synthetase TilS [Roseateles oligotrophus]MCV2369284.1 tRNA lysidine(34) synthetase TilS [Roseateles oligotrophus]